MERPPFKYWMSGEEKEILPESIRWDRLEELPHIPMIHKVENEV